MSSALFGLLAIIAAQAPELSCTQDAQGYCMDQMVRYRLAYANRDPVLSVNVALGDALTVDFPVGVTVRDELPVGNGKMLQYTLTGNAASSEMPFRLTLWPQVPEGVSGMDSEQMVGATTNIHASMDGGITLLIQVKVEHRERSVQRVILDFPERQAETTYVQKRLQTEREKLLAEVKRDRDRVTQTVATQVKQEMARSMLDAVYCEDLRERAERGLLIVRASRICRLGEHIFINFSVQNRARDLFSLGAVEVRASGESDSSILDASFEYDQPGALMLGYNGAAQGVAAFRVEPKTAPKAFDLRVWESGGKKRDVNLQQVSF